MEIPLEFLSDRPKIVLLGDSVLDNFYWLKEKKNHLRVELQALLDKSEGKNPYQVINLAMDETSTFDFVDREPNLHPWTRYAHARTKVFTKDDKLDYSYFVSHDGHYRPLSILEKISNVKHIILSVGGNDVYLYPLIQWDLLTSLMPRYRKSRTDVAKKFAKRYKIILENIFQLCPSVALTVIIPYHPHYSFNLLGLRRGCGHRLVNFIQYLSLSSLVTPLVQQILKMAKNYHIDVLDLSKTFDVNNDLYYGTGNRTDPQWSGAEPSNLSNIYIAQLCAAATAKQKEEDMPAIYMYGVPTPNQAIHIRYKLLTNFPISSYQFGPFSLV